MIRFLVLVGGLMLVPTFFNASARGEDKPAAAKNEAGDAKRPHIVFVTGDDEYRSEITMPMIASILEKRHGMKCTICYAVNEKTGERDPKYHHHIDNLEALKTADLAVFYLRFRALPDDELKQILDYVNSGRPIVALRTTTHAFQYKKGPNAPLDQSFGIDVLGQKWISHHGHDSSTNVQVQLGDHPITRGLKPEFHCTSWLYRVMPLHGDCTSLLLGAAVKGDQPTKEIFGIPNPVAWTKTYKDARVFYTSLGHPKDFEDESVRKLLINGIYWGLGQEKKIPADGTDVQFVEAYTAPATH